MLAFEDVVRAERDRDKGLVRMRISGCQCILVMYAFEQGNSDVVYFKFTATGIH